MHENINVFGTAVKGRRPWVISVLATETNFFLHEIILFYEIGANFLFLNNRLQFHVNAYWYDHSNFRQQLRSLKTVI
jgi:iron complex outermembrane receptor protein